MEPSKKNQKSMKIKDKTKPLVDINIINKQIRFMNKLSEIQKQNQQHYGGDFDDIKTSESSPKKSKKKESDELSKVIRGNLGFCFLDMSLVNLCGLPSLWIDQKQLANGYNKLLVDETEIMEPYFKPFHKNLLKKQYQIYQLLRYHRIYENDKVYGKSNLTQLNQYFSGLFVDYWQFSVEHLIDNIKYSQQKSANNEGRSHRAYALHIIQGSQDCISIDIPRPQDAEPATFKLINSEAKILKQILNSQNFQQTELNDWNFLWTSVTLQQKPQIYEQLHEYQKINHFMNSVELTRKDRFAENIQNMKIKFGHNVVDFVPETYYYPDDMSAFTQRFNQLKNKIKKQKEDNEKLEDREDNLWIYKPSQSSQGKGIFLISEVNDIPRETEKGVLCKYINNPLLINGHKFDLRVYVLVTGVDPLRIYVYNEGLARFASFPYDSSKSSIKNLFSHLTNYSINKKNENFTQNRSLDERDHGNKWSMSDLQQHLEKLGINMQPIWERIYDAVIKAIISVEHHLFHGQKKIQSSTRPSNCFELFGFDIILDSNFKPFILEVNFSPSLSADSPLDYHIKSNLLVDTLNMVGIKKNMKKRNNKTFVYPRTKNNASNINAFLQLIQAHHRTKEQTRINNSLKVEQNSFPFFLQTGNLDNYFLERLSRISAKHREIVFETLDEFQRNKNLNYTCIYPTAGCHQYDKYFEGGGRASNQLLHKYLFTKNDLFTITKQIAEYQKQFCTQKTSEDSSQSDDERLDNQSDQQETEEKAPAAKQDLPVSPQASTMTVVEETPTNEEIVKEVQPEEKPPQQHFKTQLKVDVKLDETKVIINKVEDRSISPNLKITNCENTQESDSPLPSKASAAPQTTTFIKISNLKEGQKQNQDVSPINKSQLQQSNQNSKVAESPIEQDTVFLQKYKDSNIQEPHTATLPLPKILQSIKEEVQHSPLHRVQPLEPIIKKSNTAALTQEPQRVDQKKDLKQSDSVLIKSEITESAKATPTQEIKLVKIQAETDTPVDSKQNSFSTILKDFEQGKTPEIKLKSETNEKLTEDTTTHGVKTVTDDKSKDPFTDERNTEGEVPEKKKQKMIITGDDILIEYVQRITRHLESVCNLFAKKYNQKIERVDDILPQSLRNTLEKFTMHTIWSTKLNQLQKTAPLNQKIKIRHKEMVDRRTKILTTMIKKNNKQVTPEEIKEELQTQDTNREKIISRIQSQKIEKMVKQSNAENQIDIVSILVEGHYNLPVFLQIQGGKTVINGTLSSIKMFEKILRSDKIQNFQNKIINKEAEINQGNQSPEKTINAQQREFLTEGHPTRENSKMYVQNVNAKINQDGPNAFYLLNKNMQSASKADASMNQTLNQVLTDANKRRMMNSGSASGYKNMNMANGLMISVEKNKQIGCPDKNNSYLQIGTGESEDPHLDQLNYNSISEGPKQKMSRQVVAVVHQKNSQSFMNQNQNFKGGHSGNDMNDEHLRQNIQSFDKRQRSHRNENQIIQMSNNNFNNGEMEDSIRITNASSNILTGRFQQAQNFLQQQAAIGKGLTPDFNFNRNEANSEDMNFSNKNQQLKNAFSPNSLSTNPKVSNSVISTIKTQEANQSFNEIQFELNRSHQGENFQRKIQSLKKTDNMDLHQQLQAQSVIQNTSVQRIQHETKRGSSQSHHTGQGMRSNFKNNTSTYENQPIMLHNPNANGVSFESSNMIKQAQGQSNNNRLVSFDSQQTGNRQIGGTINVQPGVCLSKQMQIKSYNGQSKQYLNQGLTLPQIANPSLQMEQKKQMLLQVAQTSNKDLNKIKNKSHI